jgi:hypothetical protein
MQPAHWRFIHMADESEFRAPQNPQQISEPTSLIDEFIENFFAYMIVGFGLGVVIILILIYLVLLSSPLLVDRYYQYIPLLQQHRLLVFTIFILLGIGLYQLRKRLSLAYAIIEIGGGLALGWNALSDIYPKGLLFWGAFMGRYIY